MTIESELKFILIGHNPLKSSKNVPTISKFQRLLIFVLSSRIKTNWFMSKLLMDYIYSNKPDNL